MKVGDRVKCVKNEVDMYNKVKKGMTGTIRSISICDFPTIGVEWDCNIDGGDLRGRCEDGHGLYFYRENIEVTKEEKNDSRRNSRKARL